MKKLLVSGMVLTGLLISWGCGKTETPPPAETSQTNGAANVEAPAPTGTVKPPVLAHTITDAEVGQQVKCPVMGTDITVTKDTLSAEYKGKVYYFCCGGCPDEFNADPEKFAK